MRYRIFADQGGGPPLVYVPGIDGTGQMLMGLAPLLAERFRLLRGTYSEEDPPDSDDYSVLAGDVAAAIDELAAGPALLLAESFGGGVALHTALQAPERVAGLALVNTFSHFARRVRLAISRWGIPLVPTSLFHLGRRFFAPRMLVGAVGGDEVDMGSFLADDDAEWFYRGYARRLAMVRGLDLRPRLGEVRQPVSLFAGDRDRIVDSVPQAERMQRLLPDAELRVIPGGGHVILPVTSLPWVDWLGELGERAGVAD